MYGNEGNGTCPGATTGKGGCMEPIVTGSGTIRRVCYMDKVARIYKGVANVLLKNTELLKEKSYEEMVVILRNTVLKWLLNGGYKAQYLRIHASGDFFSEDYARAWVRIMKEWPNVKFWVYTRSFTETLNVVPILIQAPNLALYLSCDPVNIEVALKVFEAYPDTKNLGLAYMGNNTPDVGIKFIKCPEITGKVKNEKGVGACSKCRLCFTYNNNLRLRNIGFNIH
jgi:hypothetical protein